MFCKHCHHFGSTVKTATVYVYINISLIVRPRFPWATHKVYRRSHGSYKGNTDHTFQHET